MAGSQPALQSCGTMGPSGIVNLLFAMFFKSGNKCLLAVSYSVVPHHYPSSILSRSHIFQVFNLYFLMFAVGLVVSAWNWKHQNFEFLCLQLLWCITPEHRRKVAALSESGFSTFPELEKQHHEFFWNTLKFAFDLYFTECDSFL